MSRRIVLAACVLMLTSAVHAEIASVSQTLDYTDNGSGYYFWLPTETIDHSPYFRMCNEDWGWTHDMQSLVPANATGIDAATLSIRAWDVDTPSNECDLIYANGTYLGQLDGNIDQFVTTSFELPASVLNALWSGGDVDVFMNIDRYVTGNRVTIVSSMLTVDYITNGAVPEPAPCALLGLGGLCLLRRRRSHI